MKTIDKTASTDNQPISIRELWHVFLKRKAIVAAVALTFLVIVTVVSLLTTPKYTAKGRILIEREPNILSFGNMFTIEPFSDDYFQTQYKLLESRALAADTIDRVDLAENANFLRAFLDGAEPGPDPKNDAVLRRRLVGWFLERLSVQPLRRTRLVDLTFTHTDPQLAADALNAMIESYIEMNVARRYEATEEATDFLTNEIETVQKDIKSKELKLQEYGQSTNILALNSNENTVVETLGDLNRAMTNARIDRINKETFYNEIKAAGPDYIPSALNNPVIQRLGEDYNRVSREYAKSLETFLPDYPQVQSLKAELDTAKKALEDETQDQITRAYTDWQTALSNERQLAAEFNRARGAAFKQSGNAIQYNALLTEIQNAKSLLDTLMKRKSETDVSSRLKGFRTSNIWAVDKAEVPLFPSSPNTARNMAIGLMVGIFVGLGLALLTESLDVSVKNAEDVMKFAGVPTLGMVPAFPKDGAGGPGAGVEERQETLGEKGTVLWSAIGQRRPEAKTRRGEATDLVVQFSPDSSFAEQYRSIRTALLFSMEEKNRRALAITSPLPQEGKTATACNLAASLAQAGKRVVIVDADLRKPRVHKVFRTKNVNGLSKYLTVDLAWDDLLRATPVSGLFLVNAGSAVADPLELFGSEKMTALVAQLKKDFDFILVDTPPVLAVSDALVVGARLDGVVMVVRWGLTPRDALKNAQEKLAAQKIKNLGVVINAVRMKDMDEYHISSYYGHGKQAAA
jgi:succinoglycan biosynthesis transport protein ExoP